MSVLKGYTHSVGIKASDTTNIRLQQIADILNQAMNLNIQYNELDITKLFYNETRFAKMEVVVDVRDINTKKTIMDKLRANPNLIKSLKKDFENLLSVDKFFIRKLDVPALTLEVGGLDLSYLNNKSYTLMVYNYIVS